MEQREFDGIEARVEAADARMEAAHDRLEDPRWRPNAELLTEALAEMEDLRSMSMMRCMRGGLS